MTPSTNDMVWFLIGFIVGLIVCILEEVLDND